MSRNTELLYGERWGGADVLEQMSKALAGNIKGRVFEIGSGGGRWTKWLYDNGADHVTASDVHPEAIIKTRRYEPRAKVLQTDGQSIPFEDGAFDLVFTYGVLLHLPTYLVQWYLMEAYRVANRLIFALPSFETEGGRQSYQKFIDRKAWQNAFFTGYFIHYTEDYIRQMCEYAGWKARKAGIIRDREVLFICTK